MRQNRDVRQVTEDISADITKYGDAGQRCLFVTYDPAGLIIDRTEFIDSIERHNICKAHMLR